MVEDRRPRRTRVAVEAAIAEAVFEELDELGYIALTFEGVARRAHVSKPVLYRRHSTRVSLVLSVIKSAITTTFAEPPGTGTLRGDLIAWIEQVGSQVSPSRSATLRGLLGEAGESELQQIAELMNARPRDMERCVLEPARERGEITGEIPWSVSRLFYILARDRALFGADADHDGTHAHQSRTQMIDEIILPLLRIHAGRPGDQLTDTQTETGRTS